MSEGTYITIKKLGRFGNTLIQYMAALFLKEMFDGAKICDFSLSYCNVRITEKPPESLRKIYISQYFPNKIDRLRPIIEKCPANIVIDHHMQSMGNLLPVNYYKTALPLKNIEVPVYGEDFILIHIRTGDIATGDTSWYPLVPIGFYEDVTRLTNKTPVFMGEIHPGAYVEELRSRFPNAIFLDSMGPERDFDMLRQAKNIVVSVSTFSWLAAWLSDATVVHLPLTGWLNPAHNRNTDLIPADDPRYKFYLFPINFALQPHAALAHHAKMQGLWRPVSRDFVNLLRLKSPFLMPPKIRAGVFERWYLHTYLDAAMEISNGFYLDANHHYVDVGKLRGYHPRPQALRPNAELHSLISKGKPASQSSVSRWSRSSPASVDAQGAVDGNFAKDYGFHTSQQDFPWWRLDLEADHSISAVIIYNRTGELFVQQRAFPLALELSTDDLNWSTLSIFHENDASKSNMDLMTWCVDPPLTGRYLRVQVRRAAAILHLLQVEVYGIAA